MPTPKPSKSSISSGPGSLTITSQQSRFHTETSEFPNTLKEISVKDLNVAIGGRELLSHAEFQLQRGRRYVLHGRNGMGKSTLLKAIKEDLIPSVPRGVRRGFVGQVEMEEAGRDGGELSVLEFVVRSDEGRERLLREERMISEALERGEDSMGVVKVYRRVFYERLERRLRDVRQIALRRSGARGRKTREEELKLEGEVEVARQKCLLEEASVEEMAVESKKAVEMLTDVQTSLELMDAEGAEAKARDVLKGLGFSEERLMRPRSHLSGGWRTRCSLACALCRTVDLLLLDEPTNFLDLPSIIWLERYISEELSPDTTVLVVTHDRAFGDSIAEELLILRNQLLERFRGNLSQYETDRLKSYKYLTRMKEAQEKQKSHLQYQIQGNINAARRAGDDKKLKQAASRKKKLDERMGMEVSAKGTRFRLNDQAGYFNSSRQEIEVPDFDPPVELKIPTHPPDLRFFGSLVSFEGVGFSYTTSIEEGKGKGKKAEEKILVLEDVNFTIHQGDRMGVAGLNGSGKSTLVKLVMGRKGMELDSGTIQMHPRGKIALYSQLSASELEILANSRPGLTALSLLLETMPAESKEQEARAILSGLGLVGKIASDVPISLLSGGQRVRLALARIFVDPPHLLILDEVTTHLDTDTILGLVEALKGYEGADLVVTHDRFFMKTVVEGVRVGDLAVGNRPGENEGESEESEEVEEVEIKRTRGVFRLAKGRLRRLERGMEEYEEIAARSASKLGKM
ncbi:ABC transporter, ABC-F family, GCN-EF3 type [Pseudocercospora fijiensis CIRAD86]|uniref:ABC transporter, ABC-F family, GCN-EF3 type n=1 Tax=Pseudocercospora fijiensis (strain CIRAD86) TaxID=383855 RepID=N1Q7L9_PSEFD|nr:ABC transporter, ABC-F family, GCN-EF3 type [Pseudocercospora fijiensis CIRAD86]EME88709.1 ABC transporter, ABC-F family, GCN-EF3 type [Pseudocercospora fijiensis CIRAD86]